ncbi:Fimbrin-2 [Phytophthora rubi]|uniref:Fimbrin-2 n=1 Tax=Phytophthora rubi TaxID=129364 RepID=A0A6A4DJW0_9STRA|nr:Fimbrin-2 [Phytophthora rubi]KAE8997060.1 Fimbrin-2 [Phytophthora rubi]KAE9308720.1 Fimbrin-2 [Phytophthora rubi]
MSYQVSSVFLQKFSPKEIHELKRVFKEHDRDYAAAVPVGELHTVLLKLGENVTPNQATVMLQQTKLARPELITFQEFLELLHDFRNGAIALDPALLMGHASVAPTPASVEPPVPVAAPTPTPLFPSQKQTQTPEPTQQPAPAFAQKAQWPPAGAPTTSTAAPAPVASKPQWPPAATQATSWGHTPSSAPQAPAAVPVATHAKTQWPPAGSSESAAKPQWPPAASSASAPAAPVAPPAASTKWPPAGGDKSPTKPQWPPAATSPSAPKSQWPPTSAPAEPAQKSPVSVKPPQWPPAGNGAAKSQWPPAASSVPAAPANPEPTKRAQWPPTTPPPAPVVVRTPPRSPVKTTGPPSPATEQYLSGNVDAHTLSVLQRRASAAAQYNSTIHEVKGTAGGLHSYSEEETAAFTEHINNTLHSDKDVATLMPIGMDAGLFRAVCDGVLLCKLINAAVPETIDERALNFVKRAKELNVYQKTENQNLCINAAKSIGCSVVNIGPDDLIVGKPILVLGLVWQIIKIQLTSTINLKNHPELMRLLLDGETLEQFMKLPPDQILLRWMNYHLKAAGHPKKVTNFSTDVQDATAYSVLLHHIAPQHCDLCNESVPEERAAHVIQNARRLEVETFIKPRDITSGNPKLNMSFVAQLFNTCPALDVVEEEIKQLEEILYDDVGDTREERVFRMWINSLAIDDVYINHLYSDLSDGMKLLKVLDKIQKGIVAWNKVNMVAPNKFKQVENCNYCVVLGKQLKFSLVNVGGADIFEGAKKMILSIVWQSMRYQQLRILSELAAGRGEITDKDIIGWANEKVRQAGRVKGNIVSFRDPSLSDGLYLLDLVHAVEPRAANWDMVSQEKTDDAKVSNAKYAISCAQKIGATVFLTYEDIVEVKPKMMMTFVASLMLVDHQRA